MSGILRLFFEPKTVRINLLIEVNNIMTKEPSDWVSFMSP